MRRIGLSVVAFETTRDCNLSCRFCYNHWKRPGHRDPGPAEEPSWRGSVRTLRAVLRKARVDSVAFTGGEPFLAPWLEELALEARLRGAAPMVISNGFAATPERIRDLVSVGTRLFEFPLHSDDPAEHDALAGRPGAHEASVAAIRAAVARGASAVAVFVATAANAARVGAVAELARSLGASSLMLARFNPGGAGLANLDSLSIRGDALRALFLDANEAAARFPVTSNVCVPFCAVNPADYPRVRISSCGADPESRPITVDWSGDVRMCNHSPAVLGNVRRERFEAMFASEYARSWQSPPSRCAACSLASACRGACRAASEQLGLGLEREDPVAEPDRAGA